MKSFVTISLALLVLLQSFSRVWIVMDYQINKDFIAKVLCINQDKPQLQCEGKCQLAKQLKKEERKEQQNPQKAGAKYELYAEAFSLRLPAPLHIVEERTYTLLSIRYTGRTSFDIFHPPRLNA